MTTINFGNNPTEAALYALHSANIAVSNAWGAAKSGCEEAMLKEVLTNIRTAIAGLDPAFSVNPNRFDVSSNESLTRKLEIIRVTGGKIRP